MLTQSLLWLFVAVTIKCGSFVLLERRLARKQAILFMILANVISTIPGVLIAALTGSGTGAGNLIALPIIFYLGWMVQRRVAHLPPSIRPLRISGGAAMLYFVGFFMVSYILYYLAEGVLHGPNHAAYWLFKFLFVTVVACTGIVISAVLEESVIAHLARKSIGDLTFYTSVFRANYITLGAVLLVAAIEILPKRLQSPDFITSWLRPFLATLGLA